MQHLFTRVRTVALALGFAAAASSLSILPAMAHDNSPADPAVRCAAKIGPGEYEFFMPGDRATDKDGNKWVCGPDGQWFRDYSSAIGAPLTHVTATSIAKPAVAVRR